MFTLDGNGRLYSRDGHGDKSFRDTVYSLPSGYRMCDNQVGKEDPQGERRWNPNNISWGVVFVAV